MECWKEFWINILRTSFLRNWVRFIECLYKYWFVNNEAVLSGYFFFFLIKCQKVKQKVSWYCCKLLLDISDIYLISLDNSVGYRMDLSSVALIWWDICILVSCVPCILNWFVLCFYSSLECLSIILFPIYLMFCCMATEQLRFS